MQQNHISSGPNHLFYHFDGCFFWCSVSEKRQGKRLTVWPKAEIVINGSNGEQVYKATRKQAALNHLSVRVLCYFQCNYLIIPIQDNSTYSSGGAVGNLSITVCVTSILFKLQYTVMSAVMAGSTILAA
jgi:hypothetical protein